MTSSCMSSGSARWKSPVCPLGFTLLWECLASSGHWQEGHPLIRTSRSRLWGPAGSPLRSGTNQSKVRLGGGAQRGLRGVSASSCSRTTLKPTFVNRAGHNPLLSRGEFHNLITSSEHKSVAIIPICQSMSHPPPPEHYLQTFRTKSNQIELILSPFTQGKVCVFHKICRNHLFPEQVIASHPNPPPFPQFNSIIEQLVTVSALY